MPIPTWTLPNSAALQSRTLRNALAPLVIGLGLAGIAGGLVVSAIVTRLLTTMIHGVAPLDPLTYGAVAVLLTIVVLAASWIPARRASRTDPVSVLRST